MVTIRLSPHRILPIDTVWSGSFPKFQINFLPPSSRCLVKMGRVKSTVSSVSNFYKVKVIPHQAEVAQGVPGRLWPRIFLTFGTASVVGRQPYATAAFTPGEIPSDTTGNRSRDRPTSSAVS